LLLVEEEDVFEYIKPRPRQIAAKQLDELKAALVPKRRLI
jgi:hypothetical protein